MDAIFHTGDIADLQSPDTASFDVHVSSEGDASDLLAALENICSRIYYVPGNHDSQTLFAEGKRPVLSPHSLNIHSRADTYYRLAPGLLLRGVGGSADAYDTVSHELKWRGYPAATVDFDTHTASPQIVEDITVTGIPVSQPPQARDQVILLTHIGPTGSPTSMHTTVEAGARNIASLWSPETLLHFHGHSHKGTGVCYVLGNAFPVINPGPLKSGGFCLANLSRVRGADGTWAWTVASVETLQLSVDCDDEPDSDDEVVHFPTQPRSRDLAMR